MSSALKPVMPAAGVAGVAGVGAAAGSPAKAVAAAAGAGLPQALPQGALVGQNLSQHAMAVPHPAPHPVPSMAPVSANMAQMAQNMSHHGNLSHVTQNSTPQPSAGQVVASPSKPPPVAVAAPLSLVQDKPQPLALTRTLDKKEADAQSNGTLEPPKSAANTSSALKPQNQEPNKEKQDIAKTSPSTPKPPEKITSALTTPQKAEVANAGNQGDTPALPKVATANEAPEKSPSKPVEPKPAPTADVAPTQSDNKPAPESAKDSQVQEKPSSTTPQKVVPVPIESGKTEAPIAEEKKEEPKIEKPAQNGAEEKKEVAKVETSEPAKKEVKPDSTEKLEKEKTENKIEDKEEDKVEEKKPAKFEPKQTKGEAKGIPKSTLKLATVPPPMRKRRQASPKASEGAPPAKKVAEGDASTPDSRSKRNRTQVQLYQSPTPELTMATKLSASAGRSTPTKQNDDKLIVFYKNEYLAVRNAEGGFYVCQAMQNVYRTTRKIKIRWLSQDKAADPSGEIYKPDFYDVTDMECVLTTLSLRRTGGAGAAGGGGGLQLRAAEAARARSILQRALGAGSAAGAAPVTEEHPDGLDLSLYTDESQLEKKSRKRTSSKSSPRKQDSSSDTKAATTPAKKMRTTPKRSPKQNVITKQSPPKQNNKRKSTGSTPIVAPASKTATAVTEKNLKITPKRTPAKKVEEKTEPTTPVNARAGRRSAVKESKPSPAPTPSTSTGKSTRTPRKPPNKK